MYSPGACTLRVGIYFPGRHVLLFVMIKKSQALTCTLRALGLAGQVFTFRVGIYFPGRHVLLFGMINKFQAPACTLWVAIYFSGRYLLYG